MSGSHRVVWLSATAAFVMIGCTWAFAIARYGGPDEPAHVIRAAAVAHGDLLGQPVAGLEPGYRMVTVPIALASGDPSCYRHHETTTADCAVAAAGTATVQAATSAGTTPPWYYAIVGLIARLLSDGRGVLAYRMAAVLLCAGILGQALERSRRYDAGPWLVAALTPSAWFLIGVVGTSGIEVALVLLALVEAICRFHDENAASLARVTMPLAVCLLLRPAALIDIAVVALVVLPTLPRPFTKHSLASLVAPFAIVGVATLAWNHWTSLVFRDRRTADTNPWTTTLDRALRGIPKTVHQAVGALGWNEFFAPLAAQVFWVATLALAVWWVYTHAPDRWWHARWATAGLLLPAIIELIIHRSIGPIWQGRYSIVFAMGGVLYAARVRPPSRSVRRAIVTAAACAEVLTLWHTLRRYMVGLNGSLTLQHASWQPPLDPWLLLAINGAAMAWLAVVALGSADDVAEHVDDVVGGSGVVVQRELTS
ncbi:MAG: DUF2142 domain-containing protein [Ilumatobacteraceae bacterium]